MTQPSSVTTAVRLMWAGAVLSIIPVLLIPAQKDKIREEIEKENVTGDIDALLNVAVGFAIFFGLVATGLWVWMAIMNGKGRNWARLTATVLGGLYVTLGLLGLVFGVFGGQTTVDLGITAVTVTVAIVALVAMWLRTSSQWYEAQDRAA